MQLYPGRIESRGAALCPAARCPGQHGHHRTLPGDTEFLCDPVAVARKRRGDFEANSRWAPVWLQQVGFNNGDHSLAESLKCGGFRRDFSHFRTLRISDRMKLKFRRDGF